MSKTIRKMKKITIVAIIIIAFLNSIVWGVDFEAAKNFISTGKNSSNGIQQSHLDSIGREFASIGNVLIFIGAGILVASVSYMGVLYMVSSPEKQAKLKEQLIGLVVSAIVIFGAYGIWSMISNMLETVTSVTN